MSDAAMLQHATALHERGDLAEAAALYRRILRKQPSNVAVVHALGMACAQLGLLDESIRLLRRVVDLHPGEPAVRGNYANALKLAGRREEALAEYDALVARHPHHPTAWCNRAATLNELGRNADALESIERALEITPDDPAAHHNHGNILAGLGRRTDAIAAYDRAIGRDADNPDTWIGRARACASLGRYDEAAAGYERALELRQDSLDAWRGIASAFAELGRYRTALDCSQRALVLDPDDADAHWTAAIAHFELGDVRGSLGHCERALSKRPGLDYALGHRVQAKRILCDWDELDRLTDELVVAIDEGRPVAMPMVGQIAGLDAQRQLRGARLYADGLLAEEERPLQRMQRACASLSDGRRMRVGYVSADFRNHPVGHQMRAVLARHDRSQVEAIALSLAHDAGDEPQRAFEAAADRFIDLGGKRDADVVELVRELELDIAIDLQGHTRSARPMLFARGLAPVQVNFLCPGTSGAAFIDYVIADHVVVPDDRKSSFSEQVVRIPGSFFVNDYAMLPPVDPGTLDRGAEGLPASAFVFASFCDSYKFSPDLWAGWMALLRNLPSSVLWLALQRRPEAAEALRARARDSGVSPDRIVVARQVVARHEHIARLALADLCLDTPTYNGHTTTADALWAGTPVLTVPGSGFASRVAASILSAAGLDELVLPGIDAYLARARELARAPEDLQALRARVVAARQCSPLFDAGRSVRHLEAAYRAMIERAIRGEPPAAFDIGLA